MEEQHLKEIAETRDGYREHKAQHESEIETVDKQIGELQSYRNAIVAKRNASAAAEDLLNNAINEAQEKIKAKKEIVEKEFSE